MKTKRSIQQQGYKYFVFLVLLQFTTNTVNNNVIIMVIEMDNVI